MPVPNVMMVMVSYSYVVMVMMTVSYPDMMVMMVTMSCSMMAASSSTSSRHVVCYAVSIAVAASRCSIENDKCRLILDTPIYI